MLSQLLKTVVYQWKKCLKVNFRIMAKIKIKQVKSKIGCPKVQKQTLEALGLKKINAVVEHEDTPSILGMVETVKHLVIVEK